MQTAVIGLGIYLGAIALDVNQRLRITSLTVLFSDLKGSTELIEGLDPEEAVQAFVDLNARIGGHDIRERLILNYAPLVKFVAEPPVVMTSSTTTASSPDSMLKPVAF